MSLFLFRAPPGICYTYVPLLVARYLLSLLKATCPTPVFGFAFSGSGLTYGTWTGAGCTSSKIIEKKKEITLTPRIGGKIPVGECRYFASLDTNFLHYFPLGFQILLSISKLHFPLHHARCIYCTRTSPGALLILQYGREC